MENERIIGALERIAELQEKILCRLEMGGCSSVPDTTEWIDSLKVQNLLGISSRTLYRLRKNNELLSSRIGNRYYFPLEAIFKLKYRYMK